MFDQQHQQHAVSQIDHWAHMAQESIDQAACEYMQPSAIYRPKLSIEGDQWCALYGENLQDGVAGFGKSPDDAMRDFNANWYKKLTPNADVTGGGKT